jgi:hypothetical protein
MMQEYCHREAKVINSRNTLWITFLFTDEVILTWGKVSTGIFAQQEISFRNLPIGPKSISARI